MNMKNTFLIFGLIALIVLSTVGLSLAVPGKGTPEANGPDFKQNDENGAAIWTGNGGYVSWTPATEEEPKHHTVCKGTEKLPEKAVEKKLEHGWEQGPEEKTICKQVY